MVLIFDSSSNQSMVLFLDTTITFDASIVRQAATRPGITRPDVTCPEAACRTDWN